MLALITGATVGIGASSAQILWENGYSLILTGRRGERLDQLKKELIHSKSRPGQFIETFQFDLQNQNQVQTFLDSNQKLISEVTVLLNNAGLAKGTDQVQSSKISDWDQMIDTNVKGLLSMTRGILPGMIQRNQGHIVNMGSVAGRWVYPGGAVYCATKFAVRAISEGLRQDLLGTAIRITNIEPGMVETEFSEVRLQDKAKAQAVYQGMRPLSAQDIAETILWCVQRPAHVNIQELVIFPTDQAAVVS